MPNNIFFVHVVRQIEQAVYGELRYEAVPCGRGSNEGLCGCKKGDVFEIRSKRQLPFLDGDVCYQMVLENDPQKDSGVLFLGCLSFKFPSEKDLQKNVLMRSIDGRMASGKLNRCTARANQSDFTSQIYKEFGKETRDRYYENRRRSLGGLAEISQAALKGVLICFGFSEHVVKNIVISVEKQKDAEEERWFLPIGSPVANGDDGFENFYDFFSGMRKNVSALTGAVEKIIKEDPEGFFSATTRAMSFRELGSMDPTNYAHYCALKLSLTNFDVKNLVGLCDEHSGPFVSAPHEYQKLIKNQTVVDVAGLLVERNFMASMVTLEKFEKHNCLFFEHDDGLDFPDHKSAFEPNRGSGTIEEVHVLCAEKKIMLKFSKGRKNDSESQRLMFLNGKKMIQASVFFRDAHVLSAKSFAHLFWKLSRRIQFKKLTLTFRLDWDTSFISTFWQLVKNKYHALLPPIPTFEKNTDETHLRSFEEVLELTNNICIVPSATLAAGQGEVNDNDWGFSVKSCIFGKVCEKKQFITLLKTPIGSRKFVSTSEVFKAQVSNKGVPVVPVGALISITRKMRRPVWSSATMVIPPHFSAFKISQMQDAISRVATKVDVMFVENNEKEEPVDERVLKVLKYLDDS